MPKDKPDKLTVVGESIRQTIRDEAFKDRHMQRMMMIDIIYIIGFTGFMIAFITSLEQGIQLQMIAGLGWLKVLSILVFFVMTLLFVNGYKMSAKREKNCKICWEEGNLFKAKEGSKK